MLTPIITIDNLDYNSLKHEIKVHTTRDQATAIAIPGREDQALQKFENGLYLELCHQHDRVDLFISSKADEISRRLGTMRNMDPRQSPLVLPGVEFTSFETSLTCRTDALARTIDRYIGKCAEEPTTSQLLKRQRRVAKYERELLRVGDDIQALSRFASAQIVAFRKIVKKYKVCLNSPP